LVDCDLWPKAGRNSWWVCGNAGNSWRELAAELSSIQNASWNGQWKLDRGVLDPNTGMASATQRPVTQAGRAGTGAGRIDGMTPNPYEPPYQASIGSIQLHITLLRCAAIGLWLSALMVVSLFGLMVKYPAIVQRADNPLLHVPSAVVVFALPVLGFLLLGVGSWLRVAWVAVIGLSAFVPIGLLALAAVVLT
jgi:hypothetical protein